MPIDLDALEGRMKKIRVGWQGEPAETPEPGTPAFGERARERRESIRHEILEEKPLSIEGRTKELEFRKERDTAIEKEAD